MEKRAAYTTGSCDLPEGRTKAPCYLAPRMPHLTCPTCRRTVETGETAQENQAFPFCSRRCKLVDLGNWLSGRYVVASPPGELGESLEGLTEDEPDTLLREQ